MILIEYIIPIFVTIIIYGVVINNACGRYNRYEFIIKSLFLIGIMVLCPLLLLFVTIGILRGVLTFGIFILYPICLYQFLQARVKRYHDLNMSGWYLLCDSIPILNIVLLLMTIFKRGNQGKNQYDEIFDIEKLLKIDILDFNYNMEPPLVKVYSDHLVINKIKFIFNQKKEMYVLKEDLKKYSKIEDYIKNNIDLKEDNERYYFNLSEKEFQDLIHFNKAIIFKFDELIEKNGHDFEIKYQYFRFNLISENIDKAIIEEMKKLYIFQIKEDLIIFKLSKKEIINFIKTAPN